MYIRFNSGANIKYVYNFNKSKIKGKEKFFLNGRNNSNFIAVL